MAHNPAEISASIDGLLASYTRPHQNIPVSETGGKLRCCCGKEDCAYLKYSNVALEGLEKDVRTAATLGQVRLMQDNHIPSLIGLGIVKIFALDIRCRACLVS